MSCHDTLANRRSERLTLQKPVSAFWQRKNRFGDRPKNRFSTKTAFLTIQKPVFVTMQDRVPTQKQVLHRQNLRDHQDRFPRLKKKETIISLLRKKETKVVLFGFKQDRNLERTVIHILSQRTRTVHWRTPYYDFCSPDIFEKIILKLFLWSDLNALN